MTTLDNLFLNEFKYGESEEDWRYELRLDWDNDRHQAVKLEGLEPEDVIKGLYTLIHTLKDEQERKHL
jgi:hypothetical protein